MTATDRNLRLRKRLAWLLTLTASSPIRALSPTSIFIRSLPHKRPQSRHNCHRHRHRPRSASLRALADSSSSCEAIRFPSVRRVYALSDLHTDDRENMSWLLSRCASPSLSGPSPGDAIVVAGDVSADLDTLSTTLRLLRENLGCVLFFVPGNHEAWVGGSRLDRAGILDSVDKLERVRKTCVAAGAYCGDRGPGEATAGGRPFLLGEDHGSPVLLCPVEAWYDGSLEIAGCEDLTESFDTWPWVDFVRCVWPEKYRTPRKIPSPEMVKALLDTEGTLASAARRTLEERSDLGLVTFSHFLPVDRTLPDWKDVDADVFDRERWFDHGAGSTSAKFSLVAGSRLIDVHLRSLRGDGGDHVHVFGHSHRPKDFEWEGVRYVHNPLGKPRERESGMVGIDVDFQLIWDTSHKGGMVRGPTIIRHWEERGGGLQGIQEYLIKKKRRDEVMKKLRRRRIDAMFGRRKVGGEKLGKQSSS